MAYTQLSKNFIIFWIRCKNLRFNFDFNNQNSSNFKDKITTKELMSQKNDFVIIDVRELEEALLKIQFICLQDYVFEMQRKNKLMT